MKVSKNKQTENDFKPDFEGQREGEHVLFVFRRHIIAMRKGFYVLLIPFALLSVPPLIWPNNLQLFWLPLIGLVVGLIGFSYHFLMWRYTYFLVSDQRLRQVTQKGFFGTDVVELPLSKIQNISYNIPGLFGELFKFGTVVIHTLVGDLVINAAEHPSKIYNRLQDVIATNSNEQGVYEETDI